MPEATFNNHRTATRTPGPMQSGSLFSHFPSSLRRCVASSLLSRLPTLHRRSILSHRVTRAALHKKTVLPKRTHSQVLLQSWFPAPRPTRLSNAAARASPAARHLHHLLCLSSCLVQAPSPVAFTFVVTHLCAGAILMFIGKRSAAMLCIWGHMPAPSAGT